MSKLPITAHGRKPVPQGAARSHLRRHVPEFSERGRLSRCASRRICARIAPVEQYRHAEARSRAEPRPSAAAAPALLGADRHRADPAGRIVDGTVRRRDVHGRRAARPWAAISCGRQCPAPQPLQFCMSCRPTRLPLARSGSARTTDTTAFTQPCGAVVARHIAQHGVAAARAARTLSSAAAGQAMRSPLSSAAGAHADDKLRQPHTGSRRAPLGSREQRARSAMTRQRRAHSCGHVVRGWAMPFCSSSARISGRRPRNSMKPPAGRGCRRAPGSHPESAAPWRGRRRRCSSKAAKASAASTSAHL